LFRIVSSQQVVVNIFNKTKSERLDVFQKKCLREKNLNSSSQYSFETSNYTKLLIMIKLTISKRLSKKTAP